MENKLQVILTQHALPETKSEAIKAKFDDFFIQVSEWEARLSTLSVTNVEQKAEIKMADEARKFLKNKRVEIEKTRKTLKEDALREGQTIDAIAKILTNLILPLEERAEEMAKFAEREAARIKQERFSERMDKLMPFGVAVNSAIISDMDDSTFDSFLSGVIQKDKEQKEADAKAEAERIECERLEAEQREYVRRENERLKAQLEAERAKAEAERKEAEAKAAAERAEAERKLAEERAKAEAEAKEVEAKVKAEREAAAAKLKAEAEARLKVEAELKAKADAEAKAAAEQAESERKAKNAPDKEKIAAFVSALAQVKRPELSSEDAKKLMEQVELLLTKVDTFVSQRLAEF